MRTSDAVIGRWAEVFEHFNLPPIDPRKHYQGECPVCKKIGKLRIDDKDGKGTYVCVHGAGDGWKLLQEVTGQDFKYLAKEVDRIIGNQFDSPTPVQKTNKAAEERIKFLSLPQLKGTDAERYLNSRGIYQMPRSGCRFSNGEYDTDEKRLIPCIYSIASNEYGEPVFKHLTYLENGDKAKIDTQRKMFTILENHGSVSIKLQTATTILGIAEGIETALSASHIYKIPTWAAINATLLKKFRAPTGVCELYIFADNDKNGTGLAAAFECGRANILANNDIKNVYIRWPQKVNDFNDLLTGGDEVIQWKLSR